MVGIQDVDLQVLRKKIPEHFDVFEPVLDDFIYDDVVYVEIIMDKDVPQPNHFDPGVGQFTRDEFFISQDVWNLGAIIRMTKIQVGNQVVSHVNCGFKAELQ